MTLHRTTRRIAARAAAALGFAAFAAASVADPMAEVLPVPVPGPLPVACSDVTQDLTRLGAGETPDAYWEGEPRGDGTPRYVADLLVAPADAFAQQVPIPDDRELYGRFRSGGFDLVQLVCYPTAASNARADYLLPDGRRVPRMQRNGEAPVLPPGGDRWPVLLFSHGLSGSPLGAGYLDFIELLASYGYVVVAPFHGDRRFVDVDIDGIGDAIAAVLAFDRFVAMQAVRPLGLVASLDRLLADPAWRDVADAGRVGGFGASMGGEALLLAGGAALTTSIGLASKPVLREPRLKAAVGYVPYFGQPILPAFGRDQRGVDGVALPYLAIAGTADTVAPLGQIEDAMVRLASTRQLVTIRGMKHGIERIDVPDILTWTLAFLDARVLGDAGALARAGRMARVAGGSDDATTLDYNAPTPPADDERIVVEYHNAALDHFFLTGEAAEAAMLDAGVIVPGWLRTGFEFKAWSPASGRGPAACRFFGTPGRGPNSHFYTIDADECAKVRANPDWMFEELSFAASRPQGEVCPDDRMTVTRLYNDGKGGEANHRYVTSRSETAVMLAQGWRVEGAVFCTPP